MAEAALVAVATGFASALAADAVKNGIPFLINEIESVINLDQNRKYLEKNLKTMRAYLKDIGVEFERQQKEVPESIKRCLENTHKEIKEAEDLVSPSLRRLDPYLCNSSQRLLDFCLCNGRKITDWNTRFDQVRKDLRKEFESFVNSRQAVSLSQLQVKKFLLPLPDFIGSAIGDDEKQLQTWLTEAPKVRVVSVYGMPGVGKTSLLGKVHNFYKVKDVFEAVIWVKASQNHNIFNMQGSIAQSIELDISNIHDSETRKMMLCARLEKMKFLLFLDDMWKSLNLQQLGVAFGSGKNSKVVFSSRKQGLMEAEQSIEVKTLSSDDGWKLFEKLAFKEGHVREELKDCARQFAEKCGGLPLAITVLARAMNGKIDVHDWNRSLTFMNNADPTFPDTHCPVGEDLYPCLRLSYDDLPKSRKLHNCFLYCAMYPKDHKIEVDVLVRMWIAEGLFKSKMATYSMDMEIGYEYMKILKERFLFQNVSAENLSMDNVKKPHSVWKPKYIRVHDVVRDMAIYIGEEEENHLFMAGQQLRDFSQNPNEDCKRLSLFSNEIQVLPEDFKCPKLVSLLLSRNPINYNDHLESFLTHLTSLRVLDLSHTSIESIPKSLTKIKLLEYLTLKKTPIKELPKDICNLSKLHFLDLSSCENLKSLPCTIAQLTQLQYLNLSGMSFDFVIPQEVSKLGSLKRLELNTKNSKALEGLTNLIELNVTITSQTGGDEIATTLGTWLEMRHLSFKYTDPVANKDLPQEMKNMKKLQSLVSNNVGLTRLPDCICEFEHLERLELIGYFKLNQLPLLEKLPKLKFLKLKSCTQLRDLEIGGSVPGFKMLERLDLIKMSMLKSLARPSSNGGVLINGTMPNLHVLKIKGCPKLQRLPMGLEKLPNLKMLFGEISWWRQTLWNDPNMKISLQKLFKEI